MESLIPEAEARKEGVDLSRCAPVVLADGQVWHLPRPYLALRPVFRSEDPEPVEADAFASVVTMVLPRPAKDPRTRAWRPIPTKPPRVVTVIPGASYGVEVDRLIVAVSACEDPADVVRVVLLIAWTLLQRNYDLNEDELATLLVVHPNDPAGWTMVRDIMAIVTSNEPFAPTENQS